MSSVLFPEMFLVNLLVFSTAIQQLINKYYTAYLNDHICTAVTIYCNVGMNLWFIHIRTGFLSAPLCCFFLQLKWANSKCDLRPLCTGCLCAAPLLLLYLDFKLYVPEVLHSTFSVFFLLKWTGKNTFLPLRSLKLLINTETLKGENQSFFYTFFLKIFYFLCRWFNK